MEQKYETEKKQNEKKVDRMVEIDKNNRNSVIRQCMYVDEDKILRLSCISRRGSQRLSLF